MTEAQDQLRKLTECCICLKAFTDPRTLACLHTFCIECLKQTGDAAKKNPGESMPCPLCRSLFLIPTEGMSGLPKNFNVQQLIDVTNNFMVHLGNKSVVGCDLCQLKALHEDGEKKPNEATMRCLDCGQNLCDVCAKAHKLHRLSENHSVVKLGSEGGEEDIRKEQKTRSCTVHNLQPLNFYCADCKKIICVSCFVENHKLHDCKDVTTVHTEFRKTIIRNAMKISNCAEEILSNGKVMEQRWKETLLNLAETEVRIRQRNSELKEMIDRHTDSLIEELSMIKQEQMKDLEIQKEETDRIYAALKSFEINSSELISRGSASDVCSSLEELTIRANELETDYEAFIGRPFQMTKVTFKSTEIKELLGHPNVSFVGQIECTVIGCDRSSRGQSTSSETSDNSLEIPEEQAEKHRTKAAISSSTPKEQTLSGYKKLLTHLYRKITEAGYDNSKIAPFNEKKIAALLDIDYLQNVQRELGLSKGDKRFDGIQAKHTRMAALLFELATIDSESSFDQIKSHVTELQSYITELWNAIQFLTRFRNSEVGLMPKGFQNYGNTCHFNSVLQCLLQTALLSFELTANLFGLGNVLTGFTLSEAFMKLASKYSYSEELNLALMALYYSFKETTQGFDYQSQHGGYELLLHFLDRLRVEERNARKIPSACPENQEMLTAVDRIFGGQLITAYTCNSCEETFASRKPFLGFSFPITPDEHTPEENRSKSTTRPQLEVIEASESISVRHEESDKHAVLVTSDVESQEGALADVGNYVECHFSCETEISAFEDCAKVSFKKDVIENMLQPITVETSTEPDVKNLLLRMFKISTPNVTQSLKHFTRAEVIKDEYRCRTCQKPGSAARTMTSAKRRTMISSPPAILVLHLKRSERKPAGLVKGDEYDELLNLGPFCCSGALRFDPEADNVWYSLYAVVAHREHSHSTGRYRTYVKQRDSSAHMEDELRERFLQKNVDRNDEIPNTAELEAMEKRKAVKERQNAKRPHAVHGQWFYVRDEIVRPCDAKEALNQKVLLLFYERISGTDQENTGIPSVW